MKRNLFFIIVLLFLITNIYAEENLFNRIFFNNLVNSSEIIIKNPHASFICLFGVGVITVSIMNNDLIIKDYFNNNRSEFSDKIFDLFNMAGDGMSVLALNSFLFLFGEKEKSTAEKVIAAVLTSGVTSYVIKIIAGRQRPDTTDDRYDFNPFSLNDSFPSGHTTVAFSWATVVAQNYGIWYLTYPVATLCGFARIYKNMHWASDVF
ncbi:MAG: phosphatase PAP2 family protein, partial [Candidatus Goldbacteria bacterium]|nr:phosphatase PAP2 family protein [Candidatus Goldiibacteriota bacterium]